MDKKSAKDFLLRKDAILEDPDEILNAVNSLKAASSNKISDEVQELFIGSYQGAIEFLFELGTWLTYIDEDVNSTRNIIESVVMETILQNYDRNKAITCLNDDNLSATITWLSEMIKSHTWRQTIYELATQPRNEDCPFLSLAMPCIAVDEKLIGELISVPLAWNTLEIFLKCASHVLQPLLTAGDSISSGLYFISVAFLKPKDMSSAFSTGDNNGTQVACRNILGMSDLMLADFYNEDEQLPEQVALARQLLPHFLEMGCYSEHGYLILQSLLQCLSKKLRAGNTAKKLSWLLEAEATHRSRDVSRYTVKFCGAQNFPDAMEAVRVILKTHQLCEPQIDILLRHCSEKYKTTAPVQLLRHPILITLLADALFTSNEKLLVEKEEKCAFLYVWASASDQENFFFTRDRESYNTAPYSQRISMEETLSQRLTNEVIQTGSICRNWHSMSMSGVTIRAFRDLPQLLESLARNRAVSFGVFRFLRVALQDKRLDFQLNLETMKPFCIVANELATHNHLMRGPLLALYTELIASSAECLEDLSQLEYKRMLVGMMVHLVTCGYGVPVIKTMRRLFQRNHVDLSLVRFFVLELLNLASPPYSEAFLGAMYPLVTDQDISAGFKVTSRDLINDFIEYCEKHLTTGHASGSSSSNNIAHL